MSKIIEERTSGEYPGLTRTIQIIGNDIIEIEFNRPYSNEVGDRFWKRFSNWNDESESIKSYIKNSKPYKPINETEDLILTSNIHLSKDILINNVFLPNNGKDYVYKGLKENVEKWLELVDKDTPAGAGQ